MSKELIDTKCETCEADLSLAGKFSTKELRHQCQGKWLTLPYGLLDSEWGEIKHQPMNGIMQPPV